MIHLRWLKQLWRDKKGHVQKVAQLRCIILARQTNMDGVLGVGCVAILLDRFHWLGYFLCPTRVEARAMISTQHKRRILKCVAGKGWHAEVLVCFATNQSWFDG